MTILSWIGPTLPWLAAGIALLLLISIRRKRPKSPRQRDWRDAIYNPREYRRQR